MSVRKPPALATWLLMRCASGDRGESLLGDLFEEYQTGRSAAWYWRETMAALLLFVRRDAGGLVSSRTAQVLLALSAQSALLLWLLTLSQEHRQLCPTPTLLLRAPLDLMSGAGLVAVTVSGLLWLASLSHPDRLLRRPGLLRLSVVAFAALGIGGGALSWAATRSCPTAPLACSASDLAATACAHRARELSSERGAPRHGASADAPRGLH